MNEPAIRAQSSDFPRGSCLAFAAMGLLFVLLPFCTVFGVSRAEVARVRSPDGALDAVLIEINGGATTDFAYSVRVEEAEWFGASKEVASFYGARRSDCAYGVNIRWAGHDRIRIEYQNSERAAAHPADFGGRHVEVELKAGITDPAAPCGGVEYNLRGRPKR